MNCHDLRRHTAKLEDPQRLPPESRAHLASCADCRTWYRRLLRLERDVARLPTPPSRGKAAFVGRVLSGAVPVAQPAETLPLWSGRTAHRSPRIRGQQKLALATSLAAGLLLFAAGFAALQWPQHTDPGRERVAVHAQKEIERLNLQITIASAAPTPRERMEKLADVVRSVHQKSQELAQKDEGDDVRALASWYRSVLEPELLAQARALPYGDRPGVIGAVASQLDGMSNSTEAVAAGVTGSSAQEALQLLVQHTRQTSLDLRNRI